MKPEFTDEQILAILSMLERQRFADFYTGPFEDFITGDMVISQNITHKEARNEMLKEIRKLVDRAY